MPCSRSWQSAGFAGSDAARATDAATAGRRDEAERLLTDLREVARELRARLGGVRDEAVGSVAEVIDGLENAKVGGWYQGRPAIIADIQRQPGANVIDTVDKIRQALPRLRAAMPALLATAALDLAALDGPVQGIRVGVPENYYFDGLHAEVDASVKAMSVTHPTARGSCPGARPA